MCMLFGQLCNKTAPQNKILFGVILRMQFAFKSTLPLSHTLVVMMKHKLKLKQSPMKYYRLLSITLLNKTQLNQLFDNTDLQNFKELDSNQLNLLVNLGW
jgi:hypothetical protein